MAMHVVYHCSHAITLGYDDKIADIYRLSEFCELSSFITYNNNNYYYFLKVKQKINVNNKRLMLIIIKFKC